MGKGRKSKERGQTAGKRPINLNTKKDVLIAFGQAIALTLVIAFLFYKSIFGCLVGIVVIPFWLQVSEKENAHKRKNKLLIEFKEYMMLIVASLQTGYSLEKAVKQGEIELQKLYSDETIILPYIHMMNRKIAMNVQLEKAFLEFAKTINLEEAISLAEIISFAKRSGGDYGKNIRETALKIEANLAVMQEIETVTTEKRLELKVMSIMPIGILAYITLTSKSFIAPLYGNMIGITLMTCCLIAYGALVVLGKKIIEIDV